MTYRTGVGVWSVPEENPPLRWPYYGLDVFQHPEVITLTLRTGGGVSLVPKDSHVLPCARRAAMAARVSSTTVELKPWLWELGPECRWYSRTALSFLTGFPLLRNVNLF